MAPRFEQHCRSLGTCGLLLLLVAAAFIWLQPQRSLPALAPALSQLAPAPPPVLPGHNRTATCAPLAWAAAKPQTGCADESAHPLTGCLTRQHELDSFARLLDPAPSGPVDMRCGFLDSSSRAWLAALHARTAACRDVLYTVSFSYGRLPDTRPAADAPPGLCWLAFVDAEALRALRGAPGFEPSAEQAAPAAGAATNTSSGGSDSSIVAGGRGNSSAVAGGAGGSSLAGRYGRWQLVQAEASLFSGSTARSAHLLKVLAPRLFPSARLALYLDAKVAVPAAPGAVLAAVRAAAAAAAAQGAPLALATAAHPVRGRDVFGELIATLGHLSSR